MGVNAQLICNFNISSNLVDFACNGDTLLLGTARELYRGCLDGTTTMVSNISEPPLLSMVWAGRHGYLVSGNATNIYLLDTSFGISIWSGENVSDYLRKQIRKVIKPHVDIAMYNDNEICFCASDINALYRIFSWDVQPVINPSPSGYSVADPVAYSKLSRPSSIAIFENEVLIADTGNHCVRLMDKNGISILYQDISIVPHNVVCCRNLVYFVSNNDVYTCNRVGNRITRVYRGNGRILLASSPDMLYIMEEQNA